MTTDSKATATVVYRLREGRISCSIEGEEGDFDVLEDDGLKGFAVTLERAWNAAIDKRLP